MTTMPDTITLSFPSDRAFGHLSLRSERFRWSSKAQGFIRVPAASAPDLFISEWSLTDLSPLVELPADAIWSCRLAPGLVPAGQLTYLSHLSGLKQLSLERVRLADEEDLKVIGRLPCLESLNLNGSNINDHGLRHLLGAPQLKALKLLNTDITASGLVYLPELGLQALYLNGVLVGDNGMEQIAGCSELEILEIARAGISDKSMPALCRLKKLHTLYMPANPITDRGVRYLRWAKSIRQLDLSENKISGRCVDCLKELHNLETLNLSFTDIGPEALPSLSEMTWLRELGLCGTRLSMDRPTMAELQRRLPDCEVDTNCIVIE